MNRFITQQQRSRKCIMCMPGVEQDIENWGAKTVGRKAPENFLQLPPLIQFVPHLLGHMTFLPLPPVAIRSADELTERSDKKLFKCIHYPVSVALSITCYLRFQCILRCVQEATRLP